MTEKRENWGSKLGLVLAMAGNAIGLGNFWRFPYLLAKNGGGAFMVPYFAALIIIGIPLMIVEWNLGRYGGKYGHGTLGPMVYLQAREGTSPKAAAILGATCGAIAFGVTILVNAYYNQIIGWTLGYAYFSLAGSYKGVASGDFFVSYIQSPGKIIIFWVLALAFLGYAVMRGIQKGIEAWAKFMMPSIYIFGFILIFRVLTLGSPIKPDWNPIAGLNYIWTPKWSELTWIGAMAAAGQIFFTLSIGMGIIPNYASYLKPEDDIVLSGVTTISLNEFAEVILGGTIALPICYTFLGPEGMKSGVGLSFISLPNIFANMSGGRIFGAFWFLLLFFAGFTSAIAMYQYLVALLEENLHVKKANASLMVFFLYIIVGFPVAIEPVLTKTAELVYLTELDNWVGSYLLVILGLLEAISVAWLMKGKALDEINKGSYWKVPKWFFTLFMQVLTPAMCIVLIVMSTKDFLAQGYFKFVPESYIKIDPSLGPWVAFARIIIICVLILGFYQSYVSIKRSYGEELNTNKISIRK